MRYIIIHEATKATAKKHKYMRGNKNAPEISSIYRWMVGGENIKQACRGGGEDGTLFVLGGCSSPLLSVLLTSQAISLAEPDRIICLT